MTSYDRGYRDGLASELPNPPWLFGVDEYMNGYTVGCFERQSIQDAMRRQGLINAVKAEEANHG